MLGPFVEEKMANTASSAGWDVILFGIPLIAFLIFTFFRLDEVFTSRKSADGSRPTAPKNKRKHDAMGSDPDGRPWDDQ